MGFRFRKSISLGKGFRINLSKKGVGYSWGTKGFRVSRSATGKRRSTFSLPGTGLSYVSEQSNGTTGKGFGGTNHAGKTNRQTSPGSSNLNPWVRFFLCFFFGYFGIHKFIEKRIGMGVLYLFTCGLFGFGWIIDSVVYLVSAIKYSNQKSPAPASSTATVPSSGTNQPTSVNSLNNKNQNDSDTTPGTAKVDDQLPFMGLVKKALLWIAVGCVVFFGLAALGSGAILSFLCSSLMIGIILPIESWQNFLGKYVKGKIKTLALVILPLIFLCALPSTPAENPANTPTLPPAASTAETINLATADPSEAETEAIASTTEVATSPTEHTTPTTETVHVHDYYDATCTAPKTCKTCGEVEGAAAGHCWNNATCTSPKACFVCGITEGEKGNHTWANASCTAPKTCSVCGATEGQPGDHSWVDATCVAPKTCSVCNKTEGTVGAHQYSGGNCLVCNAKDPDYQDETMVWIPTNGGNKYHSNPYCSKMKDPIQVTKSEAINRNFTPCGRCY